MRKLVLVLFLSLAACATKNVSTTIAPGAVSTFDATAYQTLLDAQAAIEQARPLAATYPSLKVPINNIIAVYNTTMDVYVLYHKALVAGIEQSPTTLQVQITNLKHDLLVFAQAVSSAKPSQATGETKK